MPHSSTKVNTAVPGQRFKGSSNVQVTTVSSDLSSEGERKTCSVCGLPWSSSVRVIYRAGKKTCVHEAAKRRMSEQERAVEGKLKSDEVAITGDDGMVRIYEKP